MKSGVEAFGEGNVHHVQVNKYERDRAARRACISHYGSACVICGLAFKDRYGPIGTGYIHVHHLVPISAVGAEYKIDPIADLRPICSNCHAVVHMRTPPFSIEDLRRRLKN